MRQVVIIFLWIFSFQLAAQDIKITARVERDTIYIGDQTYYNITVEQPSDLKLRFSEPVDTLMKSLFILEKKGPDSLFTRKQDRVTVLISFLITSFDTGFYEIPPLSVSYKNEGEEVRYYSDFIPLEVINTYIVPSDSTEMIFDIIKPYNQRVTAKEVLPWILLAIVAAAAVWYIIRRIRSRRDGEGDEPLVKLPAEPLHIIALRELDRLNHKQLWQKGDIKSFYSNLVVIIKQYLSGRFNISCVEMTTYETMDALINNGLNDEKVRITLDEIFTTADFSKFAKYRPGDDLNSVMIERAKEIVSRLASEKSMADQNRGLQKGEMTESDPAARNGQESEDILKSDPAKDKDQRRGEENDGQ